jgi:hypothetical protein
MPAKAKEPFIRRAMDYWPAIAAVCGAVFFGIQFYLQQVDSADTVEELEGELESFEEDFELYKVETRRELSSAWSDINYLLDELDRNHPNYFQGGKQ